jgi:hypothetical protein
MKNIARKKFFFFLIIFVSIFFNFQNLQNTWGTHGGVYVDRIDSFSESLVRNSVKKNILEKNYSFFCRIPTLLNPDRPYDYFKDSEDVLYFSFACITVPFYTILLKIFQIKTEPSIDIFFSVFRFCNIIFLSTLLTVIFSNFSSICKKNISIISSIILASSVGLIFWTSNLFNLSFAYLIVPAIISYSINKKFPIYSIIIFSTLGFLIQYAFFTTHSLLSVLFAFLFTRKDLQEKINNSLKVFALTVVSFFLALIIHFILLKIEIPNSSPIDLIFATTKKRLFSYEHVMNPFSKDIIYVVYTKLTNPVLALYKGVYFFNWHIIFFMLVIFFFLLKEKKIDYDNLAIFFYGIFGYLSWYVFGYQHIVSHGSMYDWYTGSITLVLSFALVVQKNI